MKRNKLRLWLRKHPLKLSSTQIIAVVFALIILLGSCLLMLPAASKSGQSCSFADALFTATSATCVTGLVPFDTGSSWTTFGHIVIITMIEVGGLGFMSMASMVVLLLRRKVGLKQRMIMAQALSLNEMDSVVRLQKWVIFGSLIVQGVGALVLFCRFLPEQGFSKAAIWGVFHAISAFCNAGFDLFGEMVPGSSVMLFQNDPVVLITLMALIAIGGLGFFVWEEVVRLHSFKKFSVYTKLVLLATAALIVGGAALILLLEWNNPGTFGPMGWGDKILNAFFQSVTLRTAGFASVDQALLTEGGKALSIIMMLIGGSSGSTGGGVKTVTFLVLVLFLMARARGKHTVHVFHRTIPQEKILDAVTIVSIVLGLAVVGAIFVSVTSQVSFLDAMYETASAIATVGLTAGVTGKLTVAGQLLIIMYMYFGRVGVLTLSLGFLMGDKAEDRFTYAHTNLLIG